MSSQEPSCLSQVSVRCCSLLFADDVGITELLVRGGPKVDHGGISVNADDEIAWIGRVIVRNGQLCHVSQVLCLRAHGPLIGAEQAVL